jgi:heterodisulfide reductase subunit A
MCCSVPVEIRPTWSPWHRQYCPTRMRPWPQFFKVPLNDDGFFVEKHAKLGPSEFATDGVFLCGLAHYPKPIDEAIAQGRASASQRHHPAGQRDHQYQRHVAETEPSICSSCGFASRSAPTRRHRLSRPMRACMPARPRSIRCCARAAACAWPLAAPGPFT